MRTWIIDKTSVRLLKNKIERMWVEDNLDIHAFNYWFYRYFTNRFRNYVLWYFDFNMREDSQKIPNGK